MCTQESHELLKRDLSAWLALEWRGVQQTGGSAVLHLRNCGLCGSTLAKTVRRAWTEDEYAVRSVRL